MFCRLCDGRHGDRVACTIGLLSGFHHFSQLSGSSCSGDAFSRMRDKNVLASQRSCSRVKELEQIGMSQFYQFAVIFVDDMKIHNGVFMNEFGWNEVTRRSILATPSFTQPTLLPSVLSY